MRRCKSNPDLSTTCKSTVRRIKSSNDLLQKKPNYKTKKKLVQLRKLSKNEGIIIANYIQDFNFAQSFIQDQKHVYSLFALSLWLYTIDNNEQRLKRISFILCMIMLLNHLDLLFPKT